MESFLIFFRILDQCYALCHENDLGGFLGAISPELWEDGRPMDMAIYNDWQTENRNRDEKDILKSIYAFLESYENKFGYDFSETKNILDRSVTEDMIQNAKRYAKNMMKR